MLTYNELSRSARRDQARQRCMQPAQDDNKSSSIAIPPPPKDSPEVRVCRPTRRNVVPDFYTPWPASPKKPRKSPANNFYMGIMHTPTFFPLERKVSEPLHRVVGFDISDGNTSPRSESPSASDASPRSESWSESDR